MKGFLLGHIVDPPVWVLGLLCALCVVLLYKVLRKDHFYPLMVSVVVGLLLAEGVCRITNLGNSATAVWQEDKTVYRDSLPVYQPGASLLYRYPDNPRGYFDAKNEVRGTINTEGFRGRETTVEKPSGIIRIAFVGDSFTVGIGVKDEDTLPARVERELEKSYSGIEVLNFGVSNSQTPFQVKYLRNYVLRFEPDVVVIVVFLNDAGKLGTRKFMNRPIVMARLRKLSHSANALLGGIETNMLSRSMIRYYRQCFTEQSPGFRRMKAALRRGNALSHEQRFRFAVALYPVLFRLHEDYPFTSAHEAVADFCREESIPFIDLLDALKGHRDRDLWVHPTDQHPNEIAQHLAGVSTARFLDSMGFLSEELP